MLGHYKIKCLNLDWKDLSDCLDLKSGDLLQGNLLIMVNHGSNTSYAISAFPVAGSLISTHKNGSLLQIFWTFI